MRQNAIRAVRFTAGLAVEAAHMLLALWAGAAAGSYAWQHGYTLPFDTDSMSAAIVFGLVAAGAVATLPAPWIATARYLVWGRPLVPCPSCGALGEPPAAHNDAKSTPKEIPQ